jgi:hypothetical protein
MSSQEGTPVTMQAVPAPEPDPLEGVVTLDSLTAAETAMAERQAGQSITTLGNDRFPQAALIGALGWVAKRRSDPRIKYDAYMQSRTIPDITRELGLSTDADDDDEEDQNNDDDASTSSS